MALHGLTFTEFDNQDEFAKKSADFIEKVICEKSGKVRIALSGGTTPEPVYKELSTRKNIPFERVCFYIVDERFVPLKSADSNYRMIKKILIDKVNPHEFHYFDTSLKIEDALVKYENKLPQNFDLCVLGIGSEGHTASLFPHSKALKEKIRFAAHTTTSEFSVKDRLTLTFPFILKSGKILVLLKGADKRKVLKRLTDSNETEDELPAKKLLTHNNLTIYFSNR